MAEAGDPPPAKGRAASHGLRVVRRAIEKAAPLPGMDHVRMPFGFEMREDRLWRLARKQEETDMRLCGPLEVLAESRPETGDEWGLLLRWRDRDGAAHHETCAREGLRPLVFAFLGRLGCRNRPCVGKTLLFGPTWTVENVKCLFSCANSAKLGRRGTTPGSAPAAGCV